MFDGLPIEARDAPVQWDQDVPAADTVAEVVLPAVANHRYILWGAWWSYSGTTPGAAGFAASVGNADVNLLLPLAVDSYEFQPRKGFYDASADGVNAALTVTVTDPADAGCTAKLNVCYSLLKVR